MSLAIFLAALLPAAAPSCASKLASEHFADLGGVYGYGSARAVSSSFSLDANVQEVAVSTQNSPSFSQRSGKLSFFPAPGSVADLVIVAISSHSVRLIWTAPAADMGDGTGTADSYMVRYDTRGFITTDAEFYSASSFAQDWPPAAPGAGESRVIEGFNPGTTYYFSIEAVNAHGLRSEVSNQAAAYALTPLPPMNFKALLAGATVTLSWIAPAGYQNRIPFSDRFSPAYPYEIKAYRVYRATAPAAAEWVFQQEVSSDTFSWADGAAGDGDYYYHARSVNQAGASLPSYARNGLSGGLYFLGPDNETSLEIPDGAGAAFFSDSGDPMQSYSVEITTSAGDLGGRVLKSVEFTAYRGGLQADPNFKLAGKARMKLYYRKSGDSIVPSAVADNNALSIFFHNGSRWLQMYGGVNTEERSVQLSTSYLGRYQLRSTERGGGFGADTAGLTNRLITPNGDGKNDTMVFIYDNPLGNTVQGRIYDLRGTLVASMTQGPLGNSLLWDARSGGRVVPGGIYIYQITAGAKRYNGTVAVIR